MTEDGDLSSKVKGLVAKAKNAISGGDDDGGTGSGDSAGPVAKVKAALSKATEAVTGLVKKDDDGAGATDAHEEPTENALKMKAAVKEARKAKDDD